MPSARQNRGKLINQSNVQTPTNRLAKKPSIGLFTLVCLIVGNMIGVGVYVGSYYSLLSLKDARLVLLVWLIGGLHALCGAIAYGAVASRLPVSGGEYSYLSTCVHPAIGFIAGWISIIAGFTAPIAASALLLGKYLVGADPGGAMASESIMRVRIIATASIVVAAALHAFHLKVGTTFNNIVIVIKLACFSIFLLVGIPFVLKANNSGILADPTSGLVDTASIGARIQQPEIILSMIVSLFYVSLAYTGFNASIYLAGEVEKETENCSQRNFVSRSMWMSCVLVMLIYLLLNFVFLYGLSSERIAQSGEGYVAVVAENIGGTALSRLIRFAIILSAATSILAMMATGPMVYAQMAADGRLPRFFQITNHVPRIAILVQSTLSCLVVWISDIEGIIKFLGLTLTACGALAVSSIWFAKKNFIMATPIRWYEHVATLFYIAGAVLFLVVASQREQNQFWLCIGAFATGALVYGATAVRRS